MTRSMVGTTSAGGVVHDTLRSGRFGGRGRTASPVAPPRRRRAGGVVGEQRHGGGNVLTDDEIDRIAEVAVDEIGGRAKVFAMGREPRSAIEAIDFAKRMLGRGVDAVQVGPVDPGHATSRRSRNFARSTTT